MTHPLTQAFRQQAESCSALGSPFMGQLCTILAARLTPDDALTRRMFDWQGDLGPSGESVPLRLAGALHALVLQGDPALAAVYPPNAAEDTALWQAVRDALRREAAFIDRFIDLPPQTNEVRRSAVLIAAGHWLAARHGLPFVFSELGASAGLNTLWDRFALALPTGTLGPQDPVLTLSPDWRGNAPPQARVAVAGRGSVDLNPLDPADPAQQLRLLAYLWPDQPHRGVLTRAAIDARPARPDQGDAIDWLETRLGPVPGRLHLIWSTVAWQYFPKAVQARGTALIEAAGSQATDDAPLAWLSYEADGQTPGAGLALRLWPGDLRLDLGRADFHGRWVEWRAP